MGRISVLQADHSLTRALYSWLTLPKVQEYYLLNGVLVSASSLTYRDLPYLQESSNIICSDHQHVISSASQSSM